MKVGTLRKNYMERKQARARSCNCDKGEQIAATMAAGWGVMALVSLLSEERLSMIVDFLRMSENPFMGKVLAYIMVSIVLCTGLAQYYAYKAGPDILRKRTAFIMAVTWPILFVFGLAMQVLPFTLMVTLVLTKVNVEVYRDLNKKELRLNASSRDNTIKYVRAN